MSQRHGSAAVAHKATPESAVDLPVELALAKEEVAFLAAVLASACRDPEASPAHLLRVSDRALQAVGRLRGAAALTVRFP